MKPTEKRKVISNMASCDRAIPNIVIAIAVPHEVTVVSFQNITNLFFIFGHYRYTVS
jgi:hypothetical protein